MGHAPPDIPPFFPSRLRAVSLVNRVSDHGECRAVTNPPTIKFAPLRKRHTAFGSQIKKAPNRLGWALRSALRACAGREKPTHNGQRH